MRKIHKNQVFRNFIVIVALLVIWTTISYTNWAKNGVNIRMWFVGIDEVIISLKDILTTKIQNVFASFLLIIKATFIVIMFGMLLGIIVGYFGNLYKSIKWILDFWRSIPPIIIIGILINLDTREELYWRIWLVIFGALPIMAMQIADSIVNSSKQKMIIFQSFNTSVFFKIRYIIIYEILPTLFSTTRTIISLSIVIIIVSEMLFSPIMGVGKQVVEFQTASEIQYVYAYAIIIGFIGFLLNASIRFLEKNVVFWKS